MITVTYRQLDAMDTDYPGVSSRIEAYTGSRQSYGLDTPINVLDIIDNVGLDEGLTAMLYTDSDIVYMSQAMALDCMKASMLPWEVIFPGDTRLRDLLQDLTVYLETKDNPVTPKEDYCGDPIPGFYGVIPESQLTDAYNSIKASSDALSITGSYYEASWWMTGGGPYSQAAIDYWEWLGAGRWYVDERDRNSTDFASIPNPQPLSGYPITKTIVEVLAEDPDYFFKESAEFDAQIVPGYTYYGVILHRVLNGSFSSSDLDEPINYMHVAVQMLVAQVKQLINMIVYDVNVFPSLTVGIRTYMLEYETERRMQLGIIIPRLQELRISGKFPNKTYNPTVDSYEQVVIDAGLNKRAELLRDYAYLSSFDADLSGTITASERATMEADVRARMLTARSEQASTLFTEVETEFNNLAQLSSAQRLVDIITPYLL